MRKDLADTGARLAKEHAVDVLLLAESAASEAQVLACLTAQGLAFASLGDADIRQDRLQVFSRLPLSKWKIRRSQSLEVRMVAWTLDEGPPPGILLVGIHLPSKFHHSDAAQQTLAIRAAQQIRLLERQLSLSRTLILGDFNMDPIDLGMRAVDGFHAVMSRQLAARTRRISYGEEFPYLYNPLWGCFGDRTPGPEGSYFHNSPDEVSPYWHLFDQVLLRPERMDSLEEVRVLDQVEGVSLLSGKNAIPDRNSYSDHLPLLVQIRWK
jgi:endonuclease/exonuclease/phosphatase family metal-dependent hydrolase